MDEPHAGDLSWSLGPANSRLVRVLLYLMFGWVPAFLVVEAGWFIGQSPGTLLLFARPVVLLAVVVFIAIVLGQLDRWERYVPAWSWFLIEFSRVNRVVWFVAAILVDALVLAALRTWVSGDVFLGEGVGPLAVLAIGTRFLISKGEIDAEAMTLFYDGWREVDLEYVTDVRIFRVGRRAFLILSFRPEMPQRSWRGPYTLPTAVADRAQPVFEAGRAAGEDRFGATDDRAETRRPSRTVLVAGILVFFGGPVILVAFLSVLGVPFEFAVTVGLFFAMFGVWFLLGHYGFI